MDLKVNGEAFTLSAGNTVRVLLDQLDLASRKVAVVVNGSIVPIADHETQPLRPGDEVDLLTLAGGG